MPRGVSGADLLEPDKGARHLVCQRPEEGRVGVLGHVRDGWKLIHGVRDRVRRERRGLARDVLEAVIPPHVQIVGCVEEPTDQVLSLCLTVWCREVVSIKRDPHLVGGVDGSLVPSHV